MLSLSFCLVIGLAFSFVIERDFALGLFFDLFIDFWGSNFRLITFEVADFVEQQALQRRLPITGKFWLLFVFRVLFRDDHVLAMVVDVFLK